MNRFEVGMSTRYTPSWCEGEYIIKIVGRSDGRLLIHDSTDDIYGEKVEREYFSDITHDKLSGDERFVSKIVGWGGRLCEFTVHDFADCDEHDGDYQRMGIDYSPSNPWDAPGMKMSDFI